jgi:hypothetical protein
VNPDVFITVVFVSWVALFVVVGAAVVRRERRREPAASDWQRPSSTIRAAPRPAGPV